MHTPLSVSEVSWIEKVCRWASTNRWRLSLTSMPHGIRVEWIHMGSMDITTIHTSDRKLALYRACSDLCERLKTYPAGPYPRFFL
jgi:hypothetical protein